MFKVNNKGTRTTPNGQTHSNNLSATVGELFECVWPFCGAGARRVKTAGNLKRMWNRYEVYKNFSFNFMEIAGIVENDPIDFHSQINDTGHKMKFSMMDFSSKCDQIRRIWSHLPNKSLMKTTFFALCKETETKFFLHAISKRLTFACSKLTVEALKKGVKYIRS